MRKRSKDEGRRSKDEGQMSKDEGQRTKVKGRRSKVMDRMAPQTLDLSLLASKNIKTMDRCFENLRVWQQARGFVNSIYDIMDCVHDFGFRDQIQRAAVSIMNNIAEGSESGSDAKFINFLQISRGSCSEVRSMLYLCLDRKMIEHVTFDKLKDEAVSISNQLYCLIEYLSKNKK